jgi:hypothetical protein
MPTVETLSREEILERRDALLAETAMTEAELRRRAADYTLTVYEAGILSEINAMEFLLGE